MRSLLDRFIEVELDDESDFLKVRETLTRIGVASYKNRALYQSCHILHKRGKYYIVHFKELFELDGKANNFSDDDRGRRNTIAKLLEDWGLVKILNPEVTIEPRLDLVTGGLKILSYDEKDDWDLIPKYTIGNART